MKYLIFILLLTHVPQTLFGIIVRHDVPDEKFIELAKQYPQICHMPMGEGTLVGASWVLTAGHVGNDLARDIKAGYSPTVICNGKEYGIESVFIHPDFSGMEHGLSNDIALVKLKESVTGVTPAKVYDGNDETGTLITIVGRGDVGTGLTGPVEWDKIVRAATNKISGVNEQWIYFNFNPPESGNATEFEGISGPGDSGGPAFIDVNGDRFVIGVSSHQRGQKEFGRGKYGVTEYYSRVCTYSDWIEKVMSEK